MREGNLVGECVPGLSESSLLLTWFGASPHGRQQRDDGAPLLTEGYHKGVKHLAGGQKRPEDVGLNGKISDFKALCGL